MKEIHNTPRVYKPLPDWYINRPNIKLSELKWDCPCGGSNEEEQKYAAITKVVQCKKCGIIFSLDKNP